MNHGGLTRARNFRGGARRRPNASRQGELALAAGPLGIAAGLVASRCLPPRSPSRPGQRAGSRCAPPPVSRAVRCTSWGVTLANVTRSSSARAIRWSRDSHQPPRNVQGLFRRAPRTTRQVESHHAKQGAAHRERLSRGCLCLQLAGRWARSPGARAASALDARRGLVRQRHSPGGRAVPAAAGGADQVRGSGRRERSNGPPGKVLDRLAVPALGAAAVWSGSS